MNNSNIPNRDKTLKIAKLNPPVTEFSDIKVALITFAIGFMIYLCLK